MSERMQSPWSRAWAVSAPYNLRCPFPLHSRNVQRTAIRCEKLPAPLSQCPGRGRDSGPKKLQGQLGLWPFEVGQEKGCGLLVAKDLRTQYCQTCVSCPECLLVSLPGREPVRVSPWAHRRAERPQLSSELASGKEGNGAKKSFSHKPEQAGARE